MRRFPLVKSRLSVFVPSGLVFLVVLASSSRHANSAGGGEAKGQRVVFASAGFDESNRFWIVSRPDHLQYDPFLETLLEVDPEDRRVHAAPGREVVRPAPTSRSGPSTCARACSSTTATAQFTAKDVVHSHSLMMRPEATATLAGFWRQVEEVKVVNDHQVVFRFKRPTTVMPYAASRAGDLRIVSKAQWDKEGLEGFEKRPAGTGSYRYVGRQPGLSVTFERVDNHWRARSRPSRSWSSGWPARSRRGWRCCSPARRTSPTCRASCRRTRSSRA